MTEQDLQTLAQASEIQRRYPDLKAQDFRVLGAIQQAGELPLAYIRARPKFFGTIVAFDPVIRRLQAANLIVRGTVAFQSTEYVGKAHRAPRKEVFFAIKQPEFVL